MKAQSQIIGYIALAAVITGIVVGVYFWGAPTLEKSTTLEQINKVENALSNLANIISESAMKSTSLSYDFYSEGSLSVLPNKIEYSISIPTAIYAASGKIPINYKIYFKCDKNYEVSPGQTINLCDNEYLEVTANTTYLIIKDKYYNKTLYLPKGNYHNIIVLNYVFDIIWDGTKYQFVQKGNVGYLGFNDPMCVVDAYVSGTASQNILYTITCRPMYDPVSKKCIEVEIEPEGKSYASKEQVTLVTTYKKSEIIDYSKYSTVCNLLEKKYVTISIQ